MRYDRPLRALPRRSLAASALLAAALLTPSARAQDRVPSSNGPGFDTHLFRPAVDSKGFFTVNGVDTLGSKNISFGLVTDYGHNLLRQPSGSDPKALVTHSFQGTFSFNVGLWNRLVLGVHVPLDVLAGDATGPIGPDGAKYESENLDAQKVGFVAPHLKLNLLSSRQPIGLALVVQAGIPTGTALARSLGADSRFWYWPHVVLERTFGNRAVRLGLDVGYRGTSPDGTTRFDGLKSGSFVSGKSLVTGGFGVAVRALDKLEFIGETYLARQLDSKSSSKLAHSQEVVGGLKVFVEKNSHLLIGGGVRVGDGYMAADQRAFLGFLFEPSITDRDGDGIPDEQDQCPDDPEDKDGFQDDDGCPDPDNDKDGIPDSRDKCPDDAETFNKFQDEDGCPDVDERDRDKDGIPDREDACPDVFGARNADPKKNGCPPDTDGDGIPDAQDACPLVAGVASPDPTKNGCPADKDGDGIPDVEDACPNVPGKSNPDPKKNGCPEAPPGPVVIENNSILILEKVQFETGSAKIRPVSNALLDAVAATLKDHPEFNLVEVQGHADARGSKALNLRLTKDRASAVVKALVSRGIADSRLRAMGYGSFCPVDPGATADAFEKNRRVEFKIVISDGKPTGVELVCSEAKQNGISSPSTP